MSLNGSKNTTGSAKPLSFEADFVQIINGQPSPTKETRHGVNPATRQAKAEVPVSTKEDVDRAVLAAREAFREWRKVPYAERRKALLLLADGIAQYRTDFRDLLIAEQGKPIPEASFEIEASIQWIQGIASLDLADEVIEENDYRKVVARYVPLGVVGAIVPWNFPLLLAVGKLAPAVLTGNVVIVKPSPFTPYCGLKFIELAQQFFPPGVIQSLSGDDKLGPWLTAHPSIDKISFTGSTNTGKLVAKSAGDTLKRITLELGGNDPAIVCADVDIETVAKQIAALSFLNSGQVCLNIKRIYVHESILPKFREALVECVNSFNIGDGSVEGVSHGPIQNEMQYKRVQTFFDDIKTYGWNVAVGGAVKPSSGYFIPPTIIDQPPDDSRIVVEEPFGPIVPLLSWKTEDDVIKRANDSPMGLGASVWSSNLEQASRIAGEMEAGSVWINGHFEPTPLAPFGGHKESGIGAEWGVNGLKGFCNVQTLFLKK